jgi:hypothetical protein
MAKAKLTLPKEWRRFANRYGVDHAYWYVPKGLAVSTDSLKPRLKVLKEFEGSKAWRECQQDYVQRLNDENISDAAAGECGGAPLARMLKQVFVMLGLAWVDPDDRVEITPAGDKFLTDKDPDGVLSGQMSRYQFTNPSVASNAHKAIELHPIPFIGEVLRSVDGQSISGIEYTLFVSRAKSFSDVDSVIEQIEAFRDLETDMQALVVKTCDAFKLPGIRRSSMYNTIRLDRSYALKMFALSRLVEINDYGGLSIRKGALKKYRPYLADYGREGAYIEFANEKDWIAYFGDPKATPTIDTALEYYVNKGDVAAAIATKKITAKSAKELAAFQDMIVSEKAVEDYLENHLEVIGSKIGAKLNSSAGSTARRLALSISSPSIRRQPITSSSSSRRAAAPTRSTASAHATWAGSARISRAPAPRCTGSSSRGRSTPSSRQHATRTIPRFISSNLK